MRWGGRLLVVLALLAGVPVDACERRTPIGLLVPLSSNWATIGAKVRNGAELAAKESCIELVVEDTGFEPRKAKDAAVSLMARRPEIRSVITASTPVSLAVKDYFASRGTFQVAVMTAGSSYSSPDDLSYRVSASFDHEALSWAGYIAQKGWKNVYALVIAGDVGAEAERSLLKALTARGLSVELTIDEYPFAEQDFKSYALRVRSRKADGVFFIGVPEHGAIFISQLRQSGVQTPVFSARGLEDKIFLSRGGKSVEGIEFTYYFNPLRQGLGWQEKFKAAHGEPLDLYSYESLLAVLLARSVEQACATYSISCINQAANAESRLLAEGISFDHFGDATLPLVWRAVKNGAFHTVDRAY